jgi:hypothetical protein
VLRKDSEVKIVTWFSHGYPHGSSNSYIDSVRNSVLKICVKRLKLVGMKISNLYLTHSDSFQKRRKHKLTTKRNPIRDTELYVCLNRRIS